VGCATRANLLRGPAVYVEGEDQTRRDSKPATQVGQKYLGVCG
jgi:hypothetical protein